MLARRQGNSLRRFLFSVLIILLVPITSVLILTTVLYLIYLMPDIQKYLQEKEGISPKIVCAPGFVELECGCYMIAKFKKASMYVDWFDLNAFCENYYAQVLSIESDAELRALNNLVVLDGFPNATTFATSGYWASDDWNRDQFKNYNFKWTATGDKLNYTKWAPGQPNIKFFDYCIGLVLSDRQLLMKASPCLEDYFICEYRGRARMLSKKAQYYLQEIKYFVESIFEEDANKKIYENS